MKNLLTMVLVAGVIFGASAGGSFFLQKKKSGAHVAKSDEHAKDEHGADAHGDATGAESTTDPAGEHAAPEHGQADEHSEPVADSKGHGSHGAATAITVPKKSAAEQLKPIENAIPGSIRPRPVSVEELLRYSLGLKNREESITQREKDIDRRQAQVNIALTDIQGEQHELDGLRRQVKEQLVAVDNMLKSVSDERQKLDADKAKAENDLKKYETSKKDDDASQRDNVKRMSGWFQGMEPETAARILKDLANQGKTDLAVQLLSNFGEREASKVLAAIEDTALTVELAEAFRTFKRPTKKDDSKK